MDKNKPNYFEEEEEDWVYSKKARERLLEEEALTSEEDGFMEGYEADLETEQEEPEAENAPESCEEEYEKSFNGYF